MKTNIILISILVILAALLYPFILAALGEIAGVFFGGMVALGAILFVGFILTVVFLGTGLPVGAIFGLVGLIMLAVAFPILAPLFIVLLPIVILIKLVT